MCNFFACGFKSCRYNSSVNICFLLHFYQPSNQSESVIKKIAHECYLPLVKLLKNDKRIRLTANFPLALLAQLDAYGFSDLIKDIKDLVDAQRLELVGSGAYHPLLTKIPLKFGEKQIMLNELAQGYYFGADKDFEGEDCYMIKDLKGFFPPEMAINISVLEMLDSLGYFWVAVDETCLPKDVISSHICGTMYKFSNLSIKLIIRDRDLSNQIAFKRDLDIASITDKVLQGDSDKLLAFDAEALGHHYPDGIDMFEAILSGIFKKGIQTSTVSQAFDGTSCKNIPHIQESTWSSTQSSIYPLWENRENKVNSALWDLFNNVHLELGGQEGGSGGDTADNIGQFNHFGTTGNPGGLDFDLMAGPVWKKSSADLTGKDTSDKDITLLDMLRLEQSDQFWWSSGVELNGKTNFSTTMVTSVLDYYRKVIDGFKLSHSLLDRVRELEELLRNYKDNSHAVV